MFTGNIPLDSARGRRGFSESGEREEITASPALNTQRIQRAGGPTQVRPGPPEESKAPTNATCREGVTNRGTSREIGRRTRKRSRNRCRRPKKNDLAEPSTPKVVDGVICLMTSKIYNVLWSIATERNAFKPHTMAVDTCSEYNLIRRPTFLPTRRASWYATVPCHGWQARTVTRSG